jgi:hypothetical protein
MKSQTQFSRNINSGSPQSIAMRTQEASKRAQDLWEQVNQVVVSLRGESEPERDTGHPDAIGGVIGDLETTNFYLEKSLDAVAEMVDLTAPIGVGHGRGYQANGYRRPFKTAELT